MYFSDVNNGAQDKEPAVQMGRMYRCWEKRWTRTHLQVPVWLLSEPQLAREEDSRTIMTCELDLADASSWQGLAFVTELLHLLSFWTIYTEK